MKPTRIHLASIAAVLSTIAIAAPVSSAMAGPASAATVTPQTFVTATPTSFINYNSQTSTGSISSGSQVAR